MSSDITQLHPDLQVLCRQWLNLCKVAGLNTRVIQTWRDPTYQDKLYAQGRTTPGPIVTKLRGTDSLHCATIGGAPAAEAFDFGCFDMAGRYITNGSDMAYTKAGVIGQGLGLHWGGNFPGAFKDPDHLEMSHIPPALITGQQAV